jgi:hypothetical protein
VVGIIFTRKNWMHEESWFHLLDFSLSTRICKDKANNTNVTTLALGSRPRQRGCKVAGQEEGSPGVKAKALQGCGPKRSRGVTSHTPGSVRKCERVWGSEHSHSQDNSHFGRWSPGGLPKFQRAIWGVKTQWFVTFFISLEISWNVDV